MIVRIMSLDYFQVLVNEKNGSHFSDEDLTSKI